MDAYIFQDLEQLRILSEEMMYKYNHEIPHGCLMALTPKEFALKAVNSGKLPTHKTQQEFTTINSHNNSSKSLNLYCPKIGKASQLISPVAKFYVPGQSEPLQGPKGYLTIIAMMRSGFPDIQWTLEEMIIENDRVAARFIMRGTHQGDF